MNYFFSSPDEGPPTTSTAAGPGGGTAEASNDAINIIIRNWHLRIRITLT